MSEAELYLGREQTLVKHIILKRYLERFAHIMGWHWNTITYVDCFSGPWNVRSEERKDSSFAIALDELRKARETHAAQGRRLKLRCFFLEKDPSAYANLNQFVDQVADAETETRNCGLAEAVKDIEEFVRKGGRESFPFVFIDPTRGTGFEMDTIAPLLRLDPGEVLINLMTGHIRRFIESPDQMTQDSFRKLFGATDFKARIVGLSQQDREDALVFEYAENLKRVGRFPYACSAIVLHPERDRTHFHLIYATRNLKGIEVFKEAERKAMQVMEKASGEAHQRKRQRKSGQRELFRAEVTHDPRYYDSLRERCLARSRERVLKLLQTERAVPYDDAWVLALTYPLVRESDLKGWLREWVGQGRLRVEGLKPRQRVPQRGRGSIVVSIQGFNEKMVRQ